MNIARLHRVESNRKGRVRSQERMCRASRGGPGLVMPTLWVDPPPGFQGQREGSWGQGVPRGSPGCTTTRRNAHHGGNVVVGLIQIGSIGEALPYRWFVPSDHDHASRSTQLSIGTLEQTLRHSHGQNIT